MKYAQPWDQPSNPNAPYIDGDQAAGIEGSIIPAEAVEDPQRELVQLINDVALATPTDKDLTQVSYATRFMRTQFVQDLGVPNAISIALNPAPIVWGTPLSWFVQMGQGNTNTSTLVTVALLGIPGTRPLAKRNGAPVQPNDLKAGDVVLMCYDGYLVRVLSFLDSDAAAPVVPPAPTSATIQLDGQDTGAYTAQWTVEQITALTAIGGNRYLGSNLTFNFNGATTGVNGMDAGTMNFYADLSVYAIYNPTTGLWGTLGCLGSVSNGSVYTGSNMPAGYTASTLIHSQVTLPGHQIRAFIQHDRNIWIGSAGVMTNGTSLGPAPINLSGAVPARTKCVAGNADCEIVQSGVSAQLYGYPRANYIGFQWFGAGYGPSSVSNPSNYGFIPCITPQTIYYQVAPAGTVFSVAVDQYQF